jgi:diguanylate cyclase (GGDEF)-like protein
MTKKAPSHSLLNPETYNSDLHDSSWMSLVRMMFSGTGVTLAIFCLLQFLAGNHLLSSLELIASLLLFWLAWRFPQLPKQVLLVTVYTAVVFCFLLFIIVMPGASSTAFVWAYLAPVLCYLLLGRVGGGMLSVPFGLLAVALYFYKYDVSMDPAGLIDLGNAVGCGILIILFMHIYEGRRTQAYQELQRIARTDTLTGVANRGCFEQSLIQSIHEAERSHNPLTLVILDIDHFKTVNDRWGHDAGDKALQHICSILGERLRITDTLGRLGGEEFALVLRNTDRAHATPLVESLRAQLCKTPLHYGKHRIELSATFGIAEWPSDGRTVDELYRCVDQRLYSGKDRGRNQVVSQEVS